MLKITITDSEHASTYNAVTCEGEVICSGRSMRYALATSPKQAAFIVTAEGDVLAASVGGVAWIPTKAGLDLVTGAAHALVAENVEATDDGASAWEAHLERNDIGDDGA